MKEMHIKGSYLGGLLFLPENVIEGMPLLVYLHGAGERGTNIEHLYRHAIHQMIADGTDFPALVFCPQCPAQYVWNNIVKELKIEIDAVVSRNNIKKDRILLTGSSMGGFGTWEMGMTYPNFFAAIAPVAGGGLSFRAQNLKTTPVWAFHGTIDSIVPPVYSELMVNAVNQNNGNAKLTLLENFDHNDGIEYTYRKTDILEWLLKQRKTNFESVSEYLCEWF